MTEAKVLNIYQRMNNVMKEVDYIKKREKKSGMVYNFVSHDDVTSLLHGPCAQHGILVIPNVESYIIDGTKHTLKMNVSFVNIDIPADRIEISTWGFALDSQDKGYGKAISYALKYALLKSFLLESGDEDEIDAYQGEPKQQSITPVKKPDLKSKTSALSAEQLEEIKKLIGTNVPLQEEIKRVFGKKAISEIEAVNYVNVMKIINGRLAA